MGLTMFLIPAALVLALWGGVMGVFLLLTVGAGVMMEFITRPL